MLRLISLIIINLILSSTATALNIAGAGSSAAAPLYKKWAQAFNEKNGVALDYQAIGSSAGIKQIKENAVDFGASDVAMSQINLKKDKLIQFPSAISGVVAVINIPGIHSAELRLSGAILASIFSRKITLWNDEQIRALNPSLRLPNKNIEVIVRKDGSGTTYNFTDYLSKIDKDWQKTYGKDFKIAWHKDLTPVKGSSGIVEQLKKTAYSISYVDFNYVVQDKLDFAQLKNRDGQFLSPTSISFAAALNASGWKKTGNFEEMLTDKSGNNVWPITMGTFVMVPKNTKQPERTIAALKFFTWAFMSGDHFVTSVDFVRLPDDVQARVFREMMTVSDENDKPLHWGAF
jgi:phosphate transport system substrate-binding protein